MTEVGAIPEAWGVRNLAEVSRKITDGDHLTPLRAPYGYYLLSARNVLNGRIDVLDVDYVGSDEYQRMRQRCAPEAGDILISCSGTIGRVAVVPRGFECVLVRSAALAKINHELADGEFLQYWLQSVKAQVQIASCVNQGAQPNLFLNHIERLACPHPPLPEQRAIAAALSDVDALLGGLDRLIAKKRDLKQAAMQQLLTGKTRLGGFKGEWAVKVARDMGTFRGGNGFPLDIQGETSGKYPFFKVSDMNNVGNEMFMTTANHWISEQARQRLGAFEFPTDTIVFAKVGAAVFLERKRILGQTSCIDNNMMAFMIDERCSDVRFVHYLLMSKKLGDLVSTTALPALNAKQLGEIEFSLPPLPEQSAIAAVLSDMDAELDALEIRRDKTRSLKQGMMQVLLTGKTRLVPAGGVNA